MVVEWIWRDIIGRMTAMATAMTDGFVFTSTTQVDAVAVRTASASSSGSDSDEPEVPLVAVATSSLEGNLWDGGLVLVDGTTGERLCGAQLGTGVGALTWCGEDRSSLVLGCDNGDVQLVKLVTDVDFALVPQQFGEDCAGHDDVVTGVAASAIEKTVMASCSWDLTVKLWDVSAMDKAVTTLDGHTDLIWDIAMNPLTVHLLATASQDSTVQLWDDRNVTQAASSTLLTTSPALSVDWHPANAHILVAGLEDGSVVTFDTRSPTEPLSLKRVHTGAVHRVKYSPFHADLVATGADDAQVVVLSNSSASDHTLEQVAVVPSSAHSDYVRALDWYQLPGKCDKTTSTWLVTGSWDKSVRTWTVSA